MAHELDAPGEQTSRALGLWPVLSSTAELAAVARVIIGVASHLLAHPATVDVGPVLVLDGRAALPQPNGENGGKRMALGPCGRAVTGAAATRCPAARPLDRLGTSGIRPAAARGALDR